MATLTKPKVKPPIRPRKPDEEIGIDPEPIAPIIVYDPLPDGQIKKLHIKKLAIPRGRVAVTLYRTKPVSFDGIELDVPRIVPVVQFVPAATADSFPSEFHRKTLFAIETLTPASQDPTFFLFLARTIQYKIRGVTFHVRHRIVNGPTDPGDLGTIPELPKNHFDHLRTDLTLKNVTTLNGNQVNVTLGWRKKKKPVSAPDGDPDGVQVASPDLFLQDTILGVNA